MCSCKTFQAEKGNIRLEGFLDKESKWLKIWRKRWCVLTSTGFFTYRTEGDLKNSTEFVLLNDCSSVHAVCHGRKRAHVIRIETPKRKMLLYACSESEMHKWINAIQDCRLPMFFEDGCHSIKLKKWAHLSRYTIPEYDDEFMEEDEPEEIQDKLPLAIRDSSSFDIMEEDEPAEIQYKLPLAIRDSFSLDIMEEDEPEEIQYKLPLAISESSLFEV
jgi:hypothetical protein